MEEKTLKALTGLSQALKEDERIQSLALLEGKLSSDPEAVALAKAKDQAEEDYNRFLETHDAASAAAQKKQKALYAAKLRLDSCPLAEEYTKAFIVVRDLYLRIDDELFSPFRGHPTCEGET